MKYGYRGSLTIEAAMLLPMITIAVMGMITLTLYLHDCTVLHGTAYEMYVTEEEVNDKHYFWLTEAEEKLVLREQYIEVVCQGEAEIRLLSYFPLRSLGAHLRCRVPMERRRVRPVEELRTIRKLHKYIGEERNDQRI